jgi:trigger factor
MTEQSSPLERSLALTVSLANVEAEVLKRLKHTAKNIRMDGFRPGKVPMNIVESQYGDQLRREVLSESAQGSFAAEVQKQGLHVAGAPHFETVSIRNDNGDYEFKATFEVFPDITLGDISAAELERPIVTVEDADVDRTIEVLRKQRTRWLPATRAAQEGDRLKINYKGFKDDIAFDGGTADNQMIVLGAGQFLPDFEKALPGVSVGETRSFDMTFPADYHAKDLAGAPVRFEVTVLEIQMPELPEVDADFARMLGIESGDVTAMRDEIKANLEREMKKRVQNKLKDQVMKVLFETTPVECPKSLLEAEIERLRENARQDWRMRTGQDTQGVDLPAALFEDQAKRRVSLGMILTEIVEKHDLKAQAVQVRTFLEEQAQSYEQPDEMMKWFYSQPDRLQEAESVVLEDNVVEWALGTAKVTDKVLPFQELIGQTA